MMVIEAIIKKVSEDPTAVLANYSSLLSALEGMIATDFTADEISELAKLELSELASWDVKTFAISGVGDSAPNYSISGMNSYVMHPDSDDVTHAKKLISKVMMGETLSDIDLEKEVSTEESSEQSTEGTY